MFISLRLYKNQYRLIAVDLSRQKKLDADPSAIQQVEYVEQLKKNNGKQVMVMINLCLF